jgi:lactose/L-arabinose transport system substrate-binding protein
MSEQKRKNSLSRRDFLRLSAGGLGAAAFAGSVGKFDPLLKPFAQGEVTGKVEIWGYNGTIDHFIAAKDMLEKKYPGLQIVTQQWQYDQAHANVLNALTSGIGVPDLANFDVDYVGSFGPGMSDLTEQFKPYVDQFVPIAVNLATYQGKLVGLPQDNEPMGFAYRKDIFDKYGITEDDLETWAGFVEAGKKLWKDSGNKIKMISMDAPGSQMPVVGEPHQIHEVFLHEAGYPGVFFNKADDKVIIDEPNAIAAIKVFKTICDPDVSFTLQDKNTSLAAYKAGLVATNICPAWWQFGLQQNIPDQAGLWRVMRLPALEKGGKRAAFQIPTVTGIPQKAANPKAAFAVLLDAQLTKEAQQRFYDNIHILPTHKEVVAKLNDTPIPYFGGEKVYGLLDEVLKDIPEVYFGRGWPEARAILATGMEPIIRGEVSVEDGLHAAAEEMRSKLNKG